MNVMMTLPAMTLPVRIAARIAARIATLSGSLDARVAAKHHVVAHAAGAHAVAKPACDLG